MGLARECHTLVLLLISPLLCPSSHSFHGKKLYSVTAGKIRQTFLGRQKGQFSVVSPPPPHHSSAAPLSQDQVHKINLIFHKHAQFLLLSLSPCQLSLQIYLAERCTMMSQINCFQSHGATEVRRFCVPLLALPSACC